MNSHTPNTDSATGSAAAVLSKGKIHFGWTKIERVLLGTLEHPGSFLKFSTQDYPPIIQICGQWEGFLSFPGAAEVEDSFSSLWVNSLVFISLRLTLWLQEQQKWNFNSNLGNRA